MKNTICVIVLLLIPFIAHGQLSYEIDTISLKTIEDVYEEYFSENHLWEDIEALIYHGPYIKAQGSLINSSDHEIVIKGVIEFQIVFSYKGKEYIVEQLPIGIGGYFSCDKEILLPPSAVMKDVYMEGFLFYRTSLDNLDKSGNVRRKANLRKAKRLARIAKIILPTVRIVPLWKPLTE